MKNLKSIQKNVVLLISILAIIDSFRQEIKEEGEKDKTLMISEEDFKSSHAVLLEKVNEIDADAKVKKAFLGTLVGAGFTKEKELSKKSEAKIRKAYEIFELKIFSPELISLQSKYEALKSKSVLKIVSEKVDEGLIPASTSGKLEAVKKSMDKIIHYLTEYNTQARATGLGYSTTVGIRNQIKRINLRLKRI